MMVSAAVHLGGLTAAKPPSEIVNLAQVVIGVSIGCRFLGIPMKEVLKTMALSAGVALFMLGLACFFALGLGRDPG